MVLPVALHLRFRIREHRPGGLLDFLRKAVPYYEQPGGIRVRLFQRIGQPDTFVEVVEYQDREVYERDQQRVEHDPAMKSLLEQWRSLHVGPVAAEAYYELNPCSPLGEDHA